MVTGDEDLIIINNTFSNVQLHTQQVSLPNLINLQKSLL